MLFKEGEEVSNIIKPGTCRWTNVDFSRACLSFLDTQSPQQFKQQDCALNS